MAALLLFGCGQDGSTIAIKRSNVGMNTVDLRITEEPYYEQDTMYRKMGILINYLEQETGLNIEYVPAINYAHAHALLVNGKVDLIWAGSLGASKILSEDKEVALIAAEEKSFINVLLVNRQILQEVRRGLDSDKPLRALKGRSVVFGSNYSGSTFLTPLIEMGGQGVTLDDLESCVHEPKHEHRAMFLGDSDHQDFAFVPGSAKDPLKFVPSEARSEVLLAWISDLKRNYYILASSQLLNSSLSASIPSIQDALLRLDNQSSRNAEILKEIGVTGFELPSKTADFASIQEVADFHAVIGDNTRCLGIDN